MISIIFVQKFKEPEAKVKCLLVIVSLKRSSPVEGVHTAKHEQNISKTVSEVLNLTLV